MDALAVLDVGDGQVTLRRARAGDVAAIVAMLAADQLGAARDGFVASHEGMKLPL